MYDKDQTTVTICVPEGYAALQMLVDLVQRDRLAMPEPESRRRPSHTNELFAKHLAIMNGPIATIGEAERRLKEGSLPRPFDAQFLPVPHAPGKKPAAFVAINGLFVFKQTKDMAARVPHALRLSPYRHARARDGHGHPVAAGAAVRRQRYPDDPVSRRRSPR